MVQDDFIGDYGWGLIKTLQIKSLTEKFYIAAQTRQFFFAFLPQTRQLFFALFLQTRQLFKKF